MLKLTLTNRDTKKDTAVLREEGILPGVFYGKSEDSQAVSMNTGEFIHVWNEAGESTIITLETEGGEKSALIRDVQVHPVSGDPVHVDFYVIEKGQKLTVNVPLEFIGESPVEDAGGIVVKILHELEVESDPQSLPSHIEVDISGLSAIGDHITVADVKLPSGVEATNDPEDIVVSTSEAREVEEEEETSTEMDLDSIEVEAKGKEADSEDGGEEASSEE